MVSSFDAEDYEFWKGHAFIFYESYINDSLDLSGFSKGYVYTEDGDGNLKNNWSITDVGEYMISPNRVVCIGNYASGAGGGADSSGMGGSESSGGSSGQSSSDGAASGIHFNNEFRLLYSSEDGSEDGSYLRKYGENAAVSRVMKEEQLEDMLEYCNSVEHYNFVSDNCAEIAGKSWNTAFDEDVDYRIWTGTPTPQALKKSIKKLDDYYSIDFRDSDWRNFINQEVVDWS